nr:M23 family metallopeptidase [Desulfobacula sp.]
MSKFPEYLAALSGINGLGKGGPVQWLFHPGMLFSSRDKWWGDFGTRASAHEGIDITYYRTLSGEIRCFDDTLLVPAMADGRIINICNDFLGRTLVVDPEKEGSEGTRVIYTYAHVLPQTRLGRGHGISRDEVVARVCDTRKNPQLPPHLHFSCFEVRREVRPEDLNWSLFSRDPAVRGINPVFL